MFKFVPEFQMTGVDKKIQRALIKNALISRKLTAHVLWDALYASDCGSLLGGSCACSVASAWRCPQAQACGLTPLW